MAAQAVDLIAQRLLGDFKILRLPARPALPEIAAAPSGHDENTLVIGEIEEFPSLEFPFQADGIQSHVADVAKFVMQALRIFAQHQVGRPTAAANQNIFSVDVEGASANRVEVGSDFANAELGGRAIADRAIDLELHDEGVEIRLPHLYGPPQARVGKDELLKFLGNEGDVFRFVGGELDILLELDGFDPAFEFSFERLIGAVFQLRRHRKLRAFVYRPI